MAALPLAAGVLSSLAVGRILAPSQHDKTVMPTYPAPVATAAAARPGEAEAEAEEKEKDDGLGRFADAGQLDVRRMAQIVWAKPTDHAGEVVIQRWFFLSPTGFSCWNATEFCAAMRK